MNIAIDISIREEKGKVLVIVNGTRTAFHSWDLAFIYARGYMHGMSLLIK